jgi:hypothetical protein
MGSSTKIQFRPINGGDFNGLNAISNMQFFIFQSDVDSSKLESATCEKF